MRELLHTAHFVVVEDASTRIITRTRTAERFASLDDVTSEYDGLARTFDGLRRSFYAQLIDVRQAPPRNDEAFETIVLRYQHRLYDGFRRVAVVVQTSAGKLQLRRFLTEYRPDAGLFTDLAEATAFLHAEGSSP